MIDQSIWRDLSHQLTKLFNENFSISTVEPIVGGDISLSYRITDTNNRHLFVKLNQSVNSDFFTCEEIGLQCIEKTQTISCPKPLLHGTSQLYTFLVMSYHNIQSYGDEFLLGQQLAKMHKHTHAYFGFDGNNYIGKTPQINTHETSWATFFLEHRIIPQLQLAYQNGFAEPLKKREQLISEAVSRLLINHQTQPSLVHGDLWGGNKGFLTDGTPIIFDPACYYGDREVDIAMTHLFGGFSNDFYCGYNSIWPLDKNYKKRMPLYNLYHQLNHLNIFGSSYLGTGIATIESLVSR